LKAKRARLPQWRAAIFLVISIVVASAVALWLHLQPFAPPKLSLSPVPFDALRGWRDGDPRAALGAFRRSCVAILRLAPTQAMGGAGYAGQARDWQGVCASARKSAAGADGARHWFETAFMPFALGMGSQRETLFTGYYEPEIVASRVRHGAYATPIYGAPDDLVIADLGLFRADLAGKQVTGRVRDHRLVPFPTRAAIDANGLDGAPVLLYARDPIAAFFLDIQGSGRARLDDGATFRLAYAAQNGHPYTSIGHTLIETGALDRAHMSMQAIRAWLEAHPDLARQTMERDESYVFFRELPIGDPTLGSPGSEGVPLAPQASLAADASVHPFGVPMFVVTEAPDADPARAAKSFARLFVAQDTGGAIKGALRADLFWGFGARAEAIAGRMKSTGVLYVFLPRAMAGRIAARFSAAQS
jgi:membrane-bound lytic murein transglycosylase A